jgi:hypothetical protein
MLFKTLSASVYGIDAYLVEVEVDVGSADMNQFNVVGLPDNAVEESRERIKAALKNCGFSFPYGQGMTINLAPVDDDIARRDSRDFSFAFYARGGHESLPVWIFRRSDARMPLHTAHDTTLCLKDFRAAVGPHRYPDRSAFG